MNASSAQKHITLIISNAAEKYLDVHIVLEL